jgi:hypothetical protein
LLHTIHVIKSLHTYIHTYIHIYTHTYIHTYISTRGSHSRLLLNMKSFRKYITRSKGSKGSKKTNAAGGGTGDPQKVGDAEPNKASDQYVGEQVIIVTVQGTASDSQSATQGARHRRRSRSSDNLLRPRAKGLISSKVRIQYVFIRRNLCTNDLNSSHPFGS